MTTSIWTSAMTVDQALDLPKGRYAADVGFNVEQSVEPHHVGESADAIIAEFAGKDEQFKAYSQAQIIVKAQELGLKWQDWGNLMLC